jgi:hypothetical protein
VGEILYGFGNHSGKPLYRNRMDRSLIDLRRLVVLSALLIFGGLLLLLPSSPLYNFITTGSTTSAIFSGFGTTDDTTTIESLLGFGLIGVGLVLEILSLFTDVGSGAPLAGTAEAERP